MRYIFPAVAVLIVVFVAVQAVPHAADTEIPDDGNVSDPEYNNDTREFAETYQGLVGEVGGYVPLVLALLGLFAALGSVG